MGSKYRLKSLKRKKNIKLANNENKKGRRIMFLDSNKSNRREEMQ